MTYCSTILTYLFFCLVKYHLNTQGSSMHSTPAYIPKSPMTEGNVYAQHQQTTADEFPERPGQPECSYFMKTGDCKFKSNCKYHHPKDRVLKSPSVVLSDKGLPLRPVNLKKVSFLLLCVSFMSVTTYPSYLPILNVSIFLLASGSECLLLL